MLFNGPHARRNLWLAIGIALAVILSIVAAVLPGGLRDLGTSAEEERLNAIRELEKPKVVETKTLTGTVQGIYGATIHLEITGSSGDAVRFASVLYETTYSLVDTRKLDASGSPTVTAIRLADIKPGDTVNVTSDDSIGTAKKFDVTEVRKVL